jgi:leucyl aminopeptidase
MRKILF